MLQIYEEYHQNQDHLQQWYDYKIHITQCISICSCVYVERAAQCKRMLLLGEKTIQLK